MGVETHKENETSAGVLLGPIDVSTQYYEDNLFDTSHRTSRVGKGVYIKVSWSKNQDTGQRFDWEVELGLTFGLRAHVDALGVPFALEAGVEASLNRGVNATGATAVGNAELGASLHADEVSENVLGFSDAAFDVDRGIVRDFNTWLVGWEERGCDART